jgi:hypothetical protein
VFGPKADSRSAKKSHLVAALVQAGALLIINQSISRCTLGGVFEGWLLVEGTDFLRVVLQLAHE